MDPDWVAHSRLRLLCGKDGETLDCQIALRRGAQKNSRGLSASIALSRSPIRYSTESPREREVSPSHRPVSQDQLIIPGLREPERA